MSDYTQIARNWSHPNFLSIEAFYARVSRKYEKPDYTRYTRNLKAILFHFGNIYTFCYYSNDYIILYIFNRSSNIIDREFGCNGHIPKVSKFEEITEQSTNYMNKVVFYFLHETISLLTQNTWLLY